MSMWKHFWKAVLRWSVALSGLMGTYSLLVYLTNESYREAGTFLFALTFVANALGHFFPLIVFFAPLSPSSMLSRPQRVFGVRAEVAAPVVAGVTAYAWLAFAEPWLKVWTFRWSAARSGVTIDNAPVASTQIWLAQQLGSHPAASEGDRLFTWLFHAPIAMGLLTALLGLAGFLSARRIVTGSQRWSIAALVTVAVAPMLPASLRLTTSYEVPPEIAAYGILLLPTFLLALLWWAGWTDRTGAPAATTP